LYLLPAASLNSQILTQDFYGAGSVITTNCELLCCNFWSMHLVWPRIRAGKSTADSFVDGYFFVKNYPASLGIVSPQSIASIENDGKQ
jgi:hypothetical protein